MALTLTDGDYEQLHRLISHHCVCRTCVPKANGAPGMRGCMVGHALAFKAARIIADQMSRGGIVPGKTEAV